jgi:hypothetical protein
MQQIMQEKIPKKYTKINQLMSSIFSVMSSKKSIDWVRRSIIGYRKQAAAQGRLGSTCRMQLTTRKAIHNQYCCVALSGDDELFIRCHENTTTQPTKK